ncbi:MAG: nicotinamide riboside transporter PnuC [Bacteroidia bacterium]|nr:MAG: nicotinamide riboside transporter PnuC [Bacteroidia bacterium]
MILNTFFQLFYENVMETTWLELIAVLFGIMSVWFARQANLLVYPTGIVSTVIYVYICFNIQLYADMGINIFYTSMSIYGWYVWTRKDDQKRVRPIRWNTKQQQAIGIALIPVLYVVIFALIYVFKKDDSAYMESYIPYVDSFTTSVFLIGMWYMARKKIENWIYWIIGNIISIPLYFVKGLVFTSFQFSVFLVLAIMGLLSWIKLYNEGRAREQKFIDDLL